MSVQQSSICDVATQNTTPEQIARLGGFIDQCDASLCDNDVTILGCNNREDNVFTLEAIFQRETRYVINAKGEFKTKLFSIIY